MSFRFLDLPGELRNVVYNQIHNPTSCRQDLGDGRVRYDIDVNLFLVNKQIYRESKPIFFHNFAFVRIETPWDATQNHLQQDGLVPILARGPMAADFKDYHMNVIIDGPRHGILDRESRKLLLLAEDLPKFCKIWSYWHLSYNAGLNEHLSLTLELQNPLNPSLELPTAIQNTLLEPFGMIKSLYQVEVDGPHSKIIEERMRNEMEVPDDSQEKCLEDATRLKDLGSAALRKGDPQTAIDYYIKSFYAIHIVCVGKHRLVWADAWFDRILRGGQFDQQHGQIVRLVLRIRLVANILKAYLDLKDYETAWFWGERTIKLMRSAMGNQDDEPFLNFPAAAETGKIYYRTAMAGKMTEKPADEVKRFFSVAHKYLPNDPKVQEELGLPKLLAL